MDTEFSFEAIGTKWSISLESGHKLVELQKGIFELIESYDKTYSRFRDDSVVSSISREPGTYKLPLSSSVLFEIYKSIYDLTDGAVSPLVGQTLSDAGYDKDYSLSFSKTTRAYKWEEAFKFKEGVLTVRKPVLFDFGAAGKGQLVDLISNYLIQNNVGQFVVNAGGDIYVQSERAVEIALQHPTDPKQAIGVANLSYQAICGSSIHLRQWGNHNHIINPYSGESPQHIHALWVISETTMLSDIISTALFFVEPKQLLSKYNFEYAIIYKDYSLIHSKNFPGTIFE